MPSSGLLRHMLASYIPLGSFTTRLPALSLPLPMWTFSVPHLVDTLKIYFFYYPLPK